MINDGTFSAEKKDFRTRINDILHRKAQPPDLVGKKIKMALLEAKHLAEEFTRNGQVVKDVSISVESSQALA